MPAPRMLFFGMAIGCADPEHAVNTLRTSEYGPPTSPIKFLKGLVAIDK
jgi:hypothetical protein